MSSEPIIVDCRGLACPMPILRARLVLNGCQTGQHLDILADDLAFDREFRLFCRLASITPLNRVTESTWTRYSVMIPPDEPEAIHP